VTFACRFGAVAKPRAGFRRFENRFSFGIPLMIAFMPARGKRFQPAAAAFPS
jgi:hypothetical protein